MTSPDIQIGDAVYIHAPKWKLANAGVQKVVGIKGTDVVIQPLFDKAQAQKTKRGDPIREVQNVEDLWKSKFY